MLIDVLERTLPYPNKCHLPFILYPPGMHRNHEGSEFLRRIDLDQPGGDTVLYIGIPFCRTRCKSCPYFISALRHVDQGRQEDAFVDAIVKDIRNWAASLGGSRAGYAASSSAAAPAASCAPRI